MTYRVNFTIVKLTSVMKKLLKYSQKVIEYGFYGLAFFVPLIFTTATFELFEFPKMILVYLLTILIVGAFLVKSIIAGKLNLKRTPLDLPILLYVACYTLSAIFSIDRYTSVFGYYTRFNGGLLSLICYVALFYVFVSQKTENTRPQRLRRSKVGRGKQRTEKFVGLLLASALLVSAYGVMQHFGIDKDYWVQDVQRRVFSTLGQPNWLAAFLVMVIPVSLSLLLRKRQHKVLQLQTIAYCLVPITLYSAFWFTHSRSGLLGFAAAIVTFLVFLGKENLKKHWRPLLLVGVAWATISILTFTPKIVAAADQGSAATAVNPTGSTVQIRLAVWRGTLELIKDYPLLGTGPETFAYSFLPYRPVELNQTAEWQFLFNKTHNEYLNIAACTGLLGLAAYLWIISRFILWNTREFIRMSANKCECANEQILRAGLFAGWIGVVVSNFFGFSVVVTSLLFWLFMALSVEIQNE